MWTKEGILKLIGAVNPLVLVPDYLMVVLSKMEINKLLPLFWAGSCLVGLRTVSVVVPAPVH